MCAFAIPWPSVTSTPSSSRSPAASRAVTLTLTNPSPSASMKPKSAAVNVYASPSSVVTVLFAAVGASFTAVTSTVMV